MDATKQRFYKEMTVGDAIALHPEAGLVFSSYHLGGCSHCSINEFETIEQVCQGYGVEAEVLLDSLNNLFADEEDEE
ncbi:MAG: disulfide oxidoreductase [Leptospiraceae bacterium]|nr:disulfide oxidoreductase [Leptospiraceae bacterium]MCP5499121.1 disulfide oxidoreductase [Leptospiraceae bacterium]